MNMYILWFHVISFHHCKIYSFQQVIKTIRFPCVSHNFVLPQYNAFFGVSCRQERGYERFRAPDLRKRARRDKRQESVHRKEEKILCEQEDKGDSEMRKEKKRQLFIFMAVKVVYIVVSRRVATVRPTLRPYFCSKLRKKPGNNATEFHFFPGCTYIYRQKPHGHSQFMCIIRIAIFKKVTVGYIYIYYFFYIHTYLVRVCGYHRNIHMPTGTIPQQLKCSYLILLPNI